MQLQLLVSGFCSAVLSWDLFFITFLSLEAPPDFQQTFRLASHFLLGDVLLSELIKGWYLRWHLLLGIQMTYAIHINETFSTLMSVPVIYGVQPWNLIMVMFQRLMDSFKQHLALTSLDGPKYQCYKLLKTSLLYALPSSWPVDVSLHFSTSVRTFFILWLWYFTSYKTIEI